jgi:hypothetical protein
MPPSKGYGSGENQDKRVNIRVIEERKVARYSGITIKVAHAAFIAAFVAIRISLERNWLSSLLKADVQFPLDL